MPSFTVPRLLRARSSEPKASTSGGTPTPNPVSTTPTGSAEHAGTLAATVTVVSSQKKTEIEIKRKPVGGGTTVITDGTGIPAATVSSATVESTNADNHAVAQEKEHELQTLREQLQQATRDLQTAEERRKSAYRDATQFERQNAAMRERIEKEIFASSLEIKLMEEAVRGARMETTRLRVQLEIERERTAVVEEKAKVDVKKLSDELAAEITSKAILSSQVNDIENKLKTLETERDNLKKKLSDDTANFEQRLAAVGRERESDRRVALQQQQRLRQELVVAKSKVPKDVTKKQQELETTIGAPVAVVRVGKWADDDLNKLTRIMINHMKTVVQTFARTKPVKKIEYLMNAELYKKYDETRSKFWSVGRSGSEVIAYHGTSQRNIDLYTIYQAQLIDRIAKEGFKVGGFNGHKATNGTCYVRALSFCLTVGQRHLLCRQSGIIP